MRIEGITHAKNENEKKKKKKLGIHLNWANNPKLSMIKLKLQCLGVGFHPGYT